MRRAASCPALRRQVRPQPRGVAADGDAGKVDLFRYVVFQDANWNWKTMDWDKDVTASIEMLRPLMEVDADLRPFFHRGGKLLLYIGWNDYHNPTDLIEYYQALVGNASAFPEVRESVEVLTRNLRSLKTGEGDVAALPGGLQPLLDPIMPLVDRAEKNAAIVLTQQKTLTQVGQALRAINRQSADLLETAETVSSLKLQQGASAAELSAVGQLVMLTQRIGKSANEFLTTEGVSAEAVFLLGKDLNSFKEIAQGVINGNADLRLPGTRDAQVRERLQQLLTQYEQVVLASYEESENAMVGFLREQARRAALAASVDANRRALTLAEQLYSSGLADFLNVLDAQRSLFVARPAARCPSRRWAGAAPTGGAARARGRRGRASAPRRIRRSAACPAGRTPASAPRAR